MKRIEKETLRPFSHAIFLREAIIFFLHDNLGNFLIDNISQRYFVEREK